MTTQTTDTEAPAVPTTGLGRKVASINEVRAQANATVPLILDALKPFVGKKIVRRPKRGNRDRWVLLEAVTKALPSPPFPQVCNWSYAVDDSGLRVCFSATAPECNKWIDDSFYLLSLKKDKLETLWPWEPQPETLTEAKVLSLRERSRLAGELRNRLELELARNLCGNEYDERN